MRFHRAPRSTPIVIPKDSTFNTQGGLLITVLGENKAPLDRQAVVKAYAKDTQNVVWQTTGRSSEVTLGNLSAGTYDIEVSATRR